MCVNNKFSYKKPTSSRSDSHPSKKCVYNIMQLNIITCIFKKKLYFSDIGKVLKLKTYATNQAYSIYLKNARYDKCL